MEEVERFARTGREMSDVLGKEYGGGRYEQKEGEGESTEVEDGSAEELDRLTDKEEEEKRSVSLFARVSRCRVLRAETKLRVHRSDPCSTRNQRRRKSFPMLVSRLPSPITRIDLKRKSTLSIHSETM